MMDELFKSEFFITAESNIRIPPWMLDLRNDLVERRKGAFLKENKLFAISWNVFHISIDLGEKIFGPREM